MLDTLAPRTLIDLQQHLGCTPASQSAAAANAAKIQAALNDTSRSYTITGCGREYFYTKFTMPTATSHSICGPPGASGRSYLLGTGDYAPQGNLTGGPALRLTSTLGAGAGAAITTSGHGGGIQDVVLNGRPMATTSSFQGSRVDTMIEIKGGQLPPTGKMRFSNITICECTNPFYFSGVGANENHSDSCIIENFCFQGFATAFKQNNQQSVSIVARDAEVLGDNNAVFWNATSGGDVFVSNIQMNYANSVLLKMGAYSQNNSYFDFRHMRWDVPGASTQIHTLVDYTALSSNVSPRINIEGHHAGFPNLYTALWAGGTHDGAFNPWDARQLLVGADGTKDALTTIKLFPGVTSASFPGGIAKYCPYKSPMEQCSTVFGSGQGYPADPQDLFSAGGFASLAAAGSANSDAANVLHPATLLTTGAPNRGVILPPGYGQTYGPGNIAWQPYRPGSWILWNTDATNAIKIYPPLGKKINGTGSTDVALSLPLGRSVMLTADGTSGNFWSIPAVP